MELPGTSYRFPDQLSSVLLKGAKCITAWYDLIPWKSLLRTTRSFRPDGPLPPGRSEPEMLSPRLHL